MMNKTAFTTMRTYRGRTLSSPRTLASVVVYVRVVRVVLDSLLEALESFLRVTLFHPYARNLDPGLCQRGLEFQRLQEVFLRAVHIHHQELEGTTEVERLRHSAIP